jgi:hypothetical protein
MNVKNLFSRIASRGPVSVALAVILSVLFVTGVVGAATTISTNIVTEGTLAVTGASTLTGAVTASDTLTVASTLGVTGASTLTGGVTVGSGTAMTRIYKGTCTLLANNSIAATSTGYAQCALSSGTVAAGDIVFVTLATTTSATGMNYTIAGAQASTTNSAYIEVKLLNLTGGAAVPAATAGFGSSTQYLIIR